MKKTAKEPGLYEVFHHSEARRRKFDLRLECFFSNDFKVAVLSRTDTESSCVISLDTGDAQDVASGFLSHSFSTKLIVLYCQEKSSYRCIWSRDNIF